MGDQINYGKLMLAVAGGIVLGALLLWLASIVFAVGLFSAVASGLNFTTDTAPRSAVTSGANYQRQLAKEQREQRQQQQRQITDRLIEQRKATPTGRRLWIQCDVWHRNYDKTPTRTTRQYRDHHCDRYSKYIKTGVVPPDL